MTEHREAEDASPMTIRYALANVAVFLFVAALMRHIFLTIVLS